jgi:hypothetical protein
MRDARNAAAAIRRPAVDLIDAVLENMRNYREPLKYSVVAPSRYTVYVHPDEIVRLNGILPLLRGQAERALSEEVAKLNRRSVVRSCMDWLLTRSRPATESASGAWHVEFLPDPDGELGPGSILVHSELLLPATPEFGVGQRTRRITTLRNGTHTASREHTEDALTTRVKVMARLEYGDGASQPPFDIVKDSVTIGRGGTAYPVSMKITASPDVSREHARIRFDAATRRYFLIDLSSLGTTIDARPVPRGYDDAGGAKRENGVEVPLHDGARIGLADTVFLTFRVVAP